MGQARILVYQPDPETLSLTARRLSKAGFDVTSVGSFADLQQQLQPDGRLFDLAFLEYGSNDDLYPEMVALVRQLKEHGTAVALTSERMIPYRINVAAQLGVEMHRLRELRFGGVRGEETWLKVTKRLLQNSEGRASDPRRK